MFVMICFPRPSHQVKVDPHLPSLPSLNLSVWFSVLHFFASGFVAPSGLSIQLD